MTKHIIEMRMYANTWYRFVQWYEQMSDVWMKEMQSPTHMRLYFNSLPFAFQQGIFLDFLLSQCKSFRELIWYEGLTTGFFDKSMEERKRKIVDAFKYLETVKDYKEKIAN